LRRWSAVAAKLSCCRSADDRRAGKFFKEVREAVSDRGGGVRSRGEAAHKGWRQGKEPPCGALTRWLLENDLVDEMTLIVIPVILGQGARLFPETGPDLALDLVESRVDSKGVTIQVHRPAGRPRYATA
jgi:hypothetical protein